jgi:hypothetical protein
MCGDLAFFSRDFGYLAFAEMILRKGKTDEDLVTMAVGF